MLLKDNKILIITIDQRYLRFLYEACNEVYFRAYNYERKPYVGVLMTVNGSKYVIPLTSAKEKHKTMKNYSNGRMLVYENVSASGMSENDVWTPNPDGSAKHILSVLNIGKMIPLKEGYYKVINVNPDPTDSIEESRYKDLLNKELQFCISNKNKIVRESEQIYANQIKTKRVLFAHCDFKVLEKKRDAFID